MASAGHSRVQALQPTTQFIGLTTSGQDSPGAKTSLAQKERHVPQLVQHSGLMVGNHGIISLGIPR